MSLDEKYLRKTGKEEGPIRLDSNWFSKICTSPYDNPKIKKKKESGKPFAVLGEIINFIGSLTLSFGAGLAFAKGNEYATIENIPFFMEVL